MHPYMFLGGHDSLQRWRLSATLHRYITCQFPLLLQGGGEWTFAVNAPSQQGKLLGSISITTVMPRNKKQAKGRGRRQNRGQNSGQVLNARGNMGYEQVIKVQGQVSLSCTTGGSSFYAFHGFGPGSGTDFTPYSTAVNYATLSQWGDFRLSKMRLKFQCQVGSGGDPISVASAQDATAGDLGGSGSATGAFPTILGRQTGNLKVVSPAQNVTPTRTFKPVELNQRLWLPQSALAVNEGLADWGVLVSPMCPASSTSILVFVEWWFDVREPTLSGVLLGKETPEEADRLRRLQLMYDRPKAPDPLRSLSSTKK